MAHYPNATPQRRIDLCRRITGVTMVPTTRDTPGSRETLLYELTLEFAFALPYAALAAEARRTGACGERDLAAGGYGAGAAKDVATPVERGASGEGRHRAVLVR